MSKTTIQINSLEALERLIGGDTEFEIEIRNSVVQAFSKKYLKSVAQQFSDRLIADEFRSVLNESLKGMATQAYGKAYKLNSDYKFLIKQEVENILQDQARQLFSSEEVTSRFKQIVDEKTKSIEQIVNRHLANTLEVTINNIVTAAVNDILKIKSK